MNDEDTDVDVLSEEELKNRANCYICGHSLLSGGKVWLFQVCGHLSCGTFYEKFYFLDCCFCFTQDGLEIKLRIMRKTMKCYIS